MTGVIGLNAVPLALELDCQWWFWYWLEQAMLVIYFVELAVRLKRWRFEFFTHEEDWKWNLLDFAIVASGMFEQWLLPLSNMVRFLMTGHRVENHEWSRFMPLLQMLRLLRILRLIRLLKEWKPLYRLTMGTLAAMHGMQWVLVLTLVLLYSFGILYTSLVGHNLLGEGITPEAQSFFRTVTESTFILFRVMTGDSTIMEPALTSKTLQLLYATFLVMAKWMMVAVLTAVVTDNMLSMTSTFEQAEKVESLTLNKIMQHDRLLTLFNELDRDGNGSLNEAEFNSLLADKCFTEELCDASGLRVEDLKDLFHFLSVQDTDGMWKIQHRDFAQKLQLESKSVRERSVLRLEKQIRVIAGCIKAKFQILRQEFGLHPHVVEAESKNFSRQSMSALRHSNQLLFDLDTNGSIVAVTPLDKQTSFAVNTPSLIRHGKRGWIKNPRPSVPLKPSG